MFYCNSCDRLVDSDISLDSVYDHEFNEWACQSCLENEADDIRERNKELKRISDYNDDFMNYSGKR